MRIDFVKMHGLGNDFIVIDDFSEEIELSAGEVAVLCDRNFGVGANGVILVRPSKSAECIAYMHYINADGSLSAMCGNGIRCFAKYLVDRGYAHASSGQFVADTLSGHKPLSFELDDDELMRAVTVDMGLPDFALESIPVSLEANTQSGEGLRFIGEAALPGAPEGLRFTCLSMGNPHAVCFLDDVEALPESLFVDGGARSLDTLDLARIGPALGGSAAFPQGANIGFASVDEEGIRLRVFERGCGETLACGTGACAAHVAACLTGRARRAGDVILKGGRLHIAWDENGHVLMSGPATEVFSGSIDI